MMALILLSSTGCKPRIAPSKLNNASIEKRDPSKAEGYLDPRVVGLNKWISELVNSKRNEDDLQVMVDHFFEEVGINDPEPLSIYRIALRVSADCFSGEWIGDTNYWQSQTEALKQQLKEAALFIADYHKANLGRPRGAFSIREVEICPKPVLGGPLKLKGQTLKIGVQQTMKNYVSLSSQQIRSMWDEGIHLDTSNPGPLVSKFFTSSKLSAIWKVFNPIGSVRLELREQILSNGINVQKKFNSLAVEYDVDLDSAASKIKPSLSTDALLKTISSLIPDLNRLGIDLDRLRSSLLTFERDGRMSLFASNFVCASKNRQFAEELALNVLSSFEKSLRKGSRRVNLEFDQGIVALGNLYDISVYLATGAVGADDFVNAPTLENNDSEIKVRTKTGDVLIYSRDQFDVQAAVSVLNQMADQGLEGWSLKSAVKATETDTSLCN